MGRQDKENAAALLQLHTGQAEYPRRPGHERGEKMRSPKRPCRWDRLCYGMLLGGAVLFLLPVFVAMCTPYVWLTLHSLPWGIYRRTQDPIRRGVLVHICLPEALAAYALERAYLGAGPCPGVYQELLKPVAAVAGDTVEISAAGVSVNGTLIPDTPVYLTDSRGRVHTVRMPEGRFIVPDGQVFVLSNYHPRS